MITANVLEGLVDARSCSTCSTWLVSLNPPNNPSKDLPTLPIRKLRHREVRRLSQTTQLASGKAKVGTWAVGFSVGFSAPCLTVLEFKGHVGELRHPKREVSWEQDFLAFSLPLSHILFLALSSRDGVASGCQHVAVQRCSSAGLSSLLPEPAISEGKEGEAMAH